MARTMCSVKIWCMRSYDTIVWCDWCRHDNRVDHHKICEVQVHVTLGARGYLPTRPMVGIFWKNFSICPPIIHQVHGGYFLKVPTTVPSGNDMGTMDGFFHNSLSNEFAPKFEHLFWVLSQSTHQCDLNVPSGFFSKNSQRTLFAYTMFIHRVFVKYEYIWVWNVLGERRWCREYWVKAHRAFRSRR